MWDTAKNCFKDPVSLQYKAKDYAPEMAFGIDWDGDKKDDYALARKVTP